MNIDGMQMFCSETMTLVPLTLEPSFLITKSILHANLETPIPQNSENSDHSFMLYRKYFIVITPCKLRMEYILCTYMGKVQYI